MIFCLTLGLALPLAGCGKTEPVTKESYYFDTVCDITIYDMEGMSEDRAEKAIRGAFRQCSYYEDTLSKTVKGSDIWKINHAAGKPVRVSDVTLEVLRDGIRFGDLTKGTFDITVGKAGLGATLSVIGGVLNIVLDWLFISVFQWGAGRRCDCNEYRICISFGGRRHLVLCEPEADPACGSAEMAS